MGDRMNLQYFFNQLLTQAEAEIVIFWLFNNGPPMLLMYSNCIINQAIDNALYLTVVDVVFSQTGDATRNTYLISQAPAVGAPLVTPRATIA